VTNFFPDTPFCGRVETLI